MLYTKYISMMLSVRMRSAPPTQQVKQTKNKCFNVIQSLLPLVFWKDAEKRNDFLSFEPSESLPKKTAISLNIKCHTPPKRKIKSLAFE